MKQIIINPYDHEMMDFTIYNGRIDQELVRDMRQKYVEGIPELDTLWSMVRVHAIKLTFHDATDAFKFDLAYDRPFQYADNPNADERRVWEHLLGDEVSSVQKHLAGLPTFI